MKALAALPLVALVAGCAIADRSDRFGADLDVGLGGLLAGIVDVRLKASVGFSKTCTEAKDAAKDLDGGHGSDPLDLRGFL